MQYLWMMLVVRGALRGEDCPETAQQAIEMVRALFVVEKQVAELSVAQRLDLHRSQSVPVLADLRQSSSAGRSSSCPNALWPRR